MLPRHLRAVCLAALGLVPACQPPDVSADVEEYVSLLNAEIELTCYCPEDLGYGNYGECVDALGEVDAGDQQCLLDVLEGNEESGKEYLDCANSALQELRECLESNPSCEAGWYDDCAEARSLALDTCTQLPSDVRLAFALCTV